MTGEAGESVASIEIRYEHTTLRSAWVTAADIRTIFGLGGTVSDDLVDRMIVLLQARPHLLARLDRHASRQGDYVHKLTHVGGQAPGDAQESLIIDDVEDGTP